MIKKILFSCFVGCLVIVGIWSKAAVGSRARLDWFAADHTVAFAPFFEPRKFRIYTLDAALSPAFVARRPGCEVRIFGADPAGSISSYIAGWAGAKDVLRYVYAGTVYPSPPDHVTALSDLLDKELVALGLRSKRRYLMAVIHSETCSKETFDPELLASFHADPNS